MPGVRDGLYRGSLLISASGSGLVAVNALDLEDYVRGVVSGESPSAWPTEALKAQAVAARTYAITTHAGGAAFDQYADTRSQVYRGVSAETPSTDAAVQATAGQVVTFGGQPVTTYFFSTSGGETEDVENSFVGSQPKPWLKAVDDPFDSVSPKHRWGPFRFTAAQVQRKLHRYLQGRFKRIKVLQRGVSPRVVRAQVVGTGGVTNVTGPQLRSAFGLFDTWAFFTSVTSKASKPKPKKHRAAGLARRAHGRRLAGRPRGRRARVAPGGHHRPGADGPLAARRAPPGHALGDGGRRARSCAAGATRSPCRARASTGWSTGRPWGRPCASRSQRGDERQSEYGAPHGATRFCEATFAQSTAGHTAHGVLHEHRSQRRTVVQETPIPNRALGSRAKRAPTPRLQRGTKP